MQESHVMDLVLIRSLLAVADAGSITDAAELAHVSQSALSRRLQQLEADLGAQLLVRGRHGVEFTDLGRQALEAGRTIVARYDDVRRRIAEQQNLERGMVRIGGGATVTSFLLPAAIAGFHSRYPGIRFYVK
jgi:DNA-binding transcriptional LysR family regulator